MAFSAPIPCNTHYGFKVITKEGIWIQFKPSIHNIREPLDLPINTKDFNPKDLSYGFLFINTELEAWRKHLELVNLHNAVAKSLSYGACSQEGPCSSSPGAPRNNIPTLGADYLFPVAKILKNAVGCAANLQNFINNFSGYIGLAVLLLELSTLVRSTKVYTCLTMCAYITLKYTSCPLTLVYNTTTLREEGLWQDSSDQPLQVYKVRRDLSPY